MSDRDWIEGIMRLPRQRQSPVIKHVIDPMALDFVKAKKFDPAKAKPPFVIEAKLDGERRMLWCGHCYSRRVSVVTGTRTNQWDALPDHIKKEFEGVTTPVDGELHVPGGTSSDVKTALKEKSHDLVFTAFDSPVIGYSVRAMRQVLLDNGFNVPDTIRPTLLPVECELGGSPVDAEMVQVPLDTLIDFEGVLDVAAKTMGLEGFILKEVKRHHVWWKFKREQTADLIVTGVKAGDGKYLGLIGALKCSVYDDAGELREVASVSGMTDDEREEITSLYDGATGAVIGRVVEVRYQQVAQRGRLRHPRFLRFRDDKNSSECKLEQLT